MSQPGSIELPPAPPGPAVLLTVTLDDQGNVQVGMQARVMNLAAIIGALEVAKTELLQKLQGKSNGSPLYVPGGPMPNLRVGQG